MLLGLRATLFMLLSFSNGECERPFFDRWLRRKVSQHKSNCKIEREGRNGYIIAPTINHLGIYLFNLLVLSGSSSGILALHQLGIHAQIIIIDAV